MVVDVLIWWWNMSLYGGGRCPYLVLGDVIIWWWEMSLYGGERCPYMVVGDVLIWWWETVFIIVYVGRRCPVSLCIAMTIVSTCTLYTPKTPL